MERLRPKTLFGRTLATIALVSIGFQLFFLLVFFYFLLLPLGQRSAEDLAQLMLNTARTWQEHPQSSPELRERFRREYGLAIGDPEAGYPVSESMLPYRYFLERALASLLHHPVSLLSSIDDAGKEWFWADLPVDRGTVRIGFPRDRIGVHPPAAILLSLMVGIQVMLITAVVLVRRLTAPLERLSRTARRLGGGQWPDPVPEEGPEELAELARSFNRMIAQVRELLANRTTLLAGISHDLRTPLTQIQLALAMLPDEGGNPELMSGIRRDMEQIDSLIGQFLEISRGLEERQKRTTIVDELIAEVVEQFRQRNAVINWTPCCDRSITLHRLSLQRIIINLAENAFRYGGESPVDIQCHCDASEVVVEVLDRGPGIPPDQQDAVFRPFFRLEGSRSRSTGGSGLGLAVVKQLCDANGWRIRLAQRPGGGTRAIVTIS
jgi:two-component system osmolarity sensor histidine kinase EnvZ